MLKNRIPKHIWACFKRTEIFLVFRKVPCLSTFQTVGTVHFPLHCSKEAESNHEKQRASKTQAETLRWRRKQKQPVDRREGTSQTGYGEGFWGTSVMDAWTKAKGGRMKVEKWRWGWWGWGVGRSGRQVDPSNKQLKRMSPNSMTKNLWILFTWSEILSSSEKSILSSRFTRMLSVRFPFNFSKLLKRCCTKITLFLLNLLGIEQCSRESASSVVFQKMVRVHFPCQ